MSDSDFNISRDVNQAWGMLANHLKAIASILISGAIVGAGAAAILSMREIDPVNKFYLIAIFSIPSAMGCAIALGVPLYVCLPKKYLNSLWICVLAPAVIALIISGLLVLKGNQLKEMASWLLVGAPCGGVLFYLCLRVSHFDFQERDS